MYVTGKNKGLDRKSNGDLMSSVNLLLKQRTKENQHVFIL